VVAAVILVVAAAVLAALLAVEVLAAVLAAVLDLQDQMVLLARLLAAFHIQMQEDMVVVLAVEVVLVEHFHLDEAQSHFKVVAVAVAEFSLDLAALGGQH
jgi:hypothetical protein